jgi:putative DNA primase/helicase
MPTRLCTRVSGCSCCSSPPTLTPFRSGKTEVARVEDVTSDWLTDFLCRAAVFMMFDGCAKGFIEINPPAHVAKTILSRDAEWKFRRLADVIATPTLGRDGSILRNAGYEPARKLLLLDPLEVSPIPGRPSRADANAGLVPLSQWA